MDQTTASYYRAILFLDAEDLRPLPPTLLRLHGWAIRRWQALGLGSIVSKQMAMELCLVWLSGTEEGRTFAANETTLGDLFGTIESPADERDIINWDEIPLESKVVVTVGDKQTVGDFLGRRASWIDVRVQGEERHFRTNQVQLASGA